ncbi:hypothetical protein llap_14463 [Limosa lapponica baueri]|uniref:Uncharacterized protein n=1 Tax=Limosa lapponica baueri TaxID=1758121 RepID=A0A2I0TNC6_LIMLA|nr:hypothetical protein llap_14463 [Limosa lapponica baueri]
MKTYPWLSWQEFHMVLLLGNDKLSLHAGTAANILSFAVLGLEQHLPENDLLPDFQAQPSTEFGGCIDFQERRKDGFILYDAVQPYRNAEFFVKSLDTQDPQNQEGLRISPFINQRGFDQRFQCGQWNFLSGENDHHTNLISLIWYFQNLIDTTCFIGAITELSYKRKKHNTTRY